MHTHNVLRAPQIREPATFIVCMGDNTTCMPLKIALYPYIDQLLVLKVCEKTCMHAASQVHVGLGPEEVGNASFYG